MADGKTHFIGNVIVGGTMTYAAWRLLEPGVWPYVAVGAAVGTLVTPDMDLEGRTHTENLMRQIPVVGLMFQFTWYPYAVLTKHRGISHSLLWGTLSRLAYMIVMSAFWAMVIVGLSWYAGGDPQKWLDGIREFLMQFRSAYLLAAWYLQDVTHYVLDW